MSQSKITIIGIADYLENVENDDLFKFMDIPEGIEKTVLTDNIMIRGGDFEVIYPDPYFMQKSIGTWSKKWYRTFEKWIEAITTDYDPIENYNRYEEWTDKLDSTSSENVKDSRKTTRLENKTDNTVSDMTSTVTVGTDQSEVTDATNETTVSAYDSDGYQPKEKVDTDAKVDTSTTSSTNSTDNQNINLTEQLSGSDDTDIESNTSGKRDDTTTHLGHIHGNIGVTTSQQMIQSSLDLARFNIIEQITDIFLREFIIPIY